MDAVKVILLKKEGVYGTDAVPTAAANAWLTRNYSTTPIEVDQIDRNLDKPSRGRIKSTPSNPRKRSSFEVDLSGSGVAGTPAPWMEGLAICGMEDPVIAANVDARQKFAGYGAQLSAATIYDWSSATQRSRGLGTRGTFSWDFTAGQNPFLKFDLTSMTPPALPVDASAVPGNPAFARWIDPIEANVDNTVFVLGGVAAVVRSFTGDTGADVKVRNLIGQRYIQRGNHAVTGRLMLEAPDPASQNLFETLRKGDEMPWSITHGTIAGNIVGMSSQHLQILSIALMDEDDKLMADISYGLNISAAQDDLLIISK